MDYLKLALKARVYDVARETPLELAQSLSALWRNRIFFKREDLQSVFSFKLRGAYNKIAHMDEASRQKGVIASSAGNHAQGVALSAKKLGVKATIVMPQTTPKIKVDAVVRLGAKIILAGDHYDDAYAHALRLAEAEGLVFVHPYDDPLVIAGQGTIGLEIVRQLQDIAAIFVPVGGGGLIAGIASVVKALYPSIQIIGVEPYEADAMYRSLMAKERILLPHVGLFADGVAVKTVGKETFRICQSSVDSIIRVDNDAICAAIKEIFEDTRAIVEPAGALALAGLKQYLEAHRPLHQNFVAILSGANMNFGRLRYVAERAELGEGKEALLVVTIPEKPGSFRAFCRLLGKRQITEFNYRYANTDKAHVFVGLEVHQTAEAVAIMEILQKHKLPAIDLSGNEAAKLHLRHLVGGLAPAIVNERFYRFEFPERPGALGLFLDAMHEKWNITLFHYRNHGADFGRVLVGFDVPQSDMVLFQSFLEGVGYPYWDETKNEAINLFLRP